MRDYGEFAECFLLSVVAFARLGSFIRMKDARLELLIYRDKYVLDKLPVAPSKAVTENLASQPLVVLLLVVEVKPASIFVAFRKLAGRLVWRSCKMYWSCSLV